jgi:hypothetical protein
MILDLFALSFLSVALCSIPVGSTGSFGDHKGIMILKNRRVFLLIMGKSGSLKKLKYIKKIAKTC